MILLLYQLSYTATRAARFEFARQLARGRGGHASGGTHFRLECRATPKPKGREHGMLNQFWMHNEYWSVIGLASTVLLMLILFGVALSSLGGGDDAD